MPLRRYNTASRVFKTAPRRIQAAAFKPPPPSRRLQRVAKKCFVCKLQVWRGYLTKTMFLQIVLTLFHTFWSNKMPLRHRKMVSRLLKMAPIRLRDAPKTLRDSWRRLQRVAKKRFVWKLYFWAIYLTRRQFFWRLQDASEIPSSPLKAICKTVQDGSKPLRDASKMLLGDIFGSLYNENSFLDGFACNQ